MMRQAFALGGEAKVEYVRGMFSAISPRYDLMNALMTFGRDRAWRKMAADLAYPSPHGYALDLATGTGELAFALATRSKGVIALDFCPDMMAYGERKAAQKGLDGRVSFLLGDALSLPFEARTFECITIGFGLRNLLSLRPAFAEMRRVLKPGGRVISLELTQPSPGLLTPFFGLYFQGFVPWLGRWVSGHPTAYDYLPASLTSFPSAQELAALMEEAGLRQVGYKLLNMGTIALHFGER